MRTIERDIVGPFIFSSDKKILLGNAAVYAGDFVVPGGGIEQGETKRQALDRETFEETGIDISGMDVEKLPGVGKGQSEKTDRFTGERYIVNMRFHDYRIQLEMPASAMEIRRDDDFSNAGWYSSNDLVGKRIGEGTKSRLVEMEFIDG